MARDYKYSPEDYTHMLSMTDDLTTFYTLYEAYIADKTQSNLFALEKQGRELFFTIKHRALAGFITATTANEMKAYIEDLLND